MLSFPFQAVVVIRKSLCNRNHDHMAMVIHASPVNIYLYANCVYVFLLITPTVFVLKAPKLMSL